MSYIIFTSINYLMTCDCTPLISLSQAEPNFLNHAKGCFKFFIQSRFMSIPHNILTLKHTIKTLSYNLFFSLEFLNFEFIFKQL